MSREFWTDAQDARLVELIACQLGAAECALALGRTKGAVYTRAAKRGLSFKSRASREVREHLKRGAKLCRDDVGGVVGVHWSCASRSAGAFDAGVCEKFVELGLLRPLTDRPNVFGGGK